MCREVSLFGSQNTMSSLADALNPEIGKCVCARKRRFRFVWGGLETAFQLIFPIVTGIHLVIHCSLIVATAALDGAASMSPNKFHYFRTADKQTDTIIILAKDWFNFNKNMFTTNKTKRSTDEVALFTLFGSFPPAITFTIDICIDLGGRPSAFLLCNNIGCDWVNASERETCCGLRLNTSCVVGGDQSIVCRRRHTVNAVVIRRMWSPRWML